MARCFVIQPFDRGRFDKRYDDVFAPAIREAGLEPYRVDEDPAASIPIDAIEQGIRGSRICLAEITSDNPNVWFELGFAIAIHRDVVLVCADDRPDKFPFDVQHRSIIRYKTEAPQDFTELRRKISNRISALLQKQANIATASEMSPIRDTEGLSPHEMAALVSVAQASFMAREGVWPWTILEDMEQAGFTKLGTTLALSALERKGLILAEQKLDGDGHGPFSIRSVTPVGETWILENQEKLVLRRRTSG